MSERTRTLAARLERVSEEVITFIRQCPDEDWRAVTKEEQWPVCSVCRHIARGFEVHPHVIRIAATGQAMPSGYNWEDVHRSNAEQAREWVAITKEDVLLPLRRYSGEAISFLNKLSDEQLDHRATSPLDDATVSVRQMIEGMIDHARIHLASVRATIKEY